MDQPDLCGFEFVPEESELMEELGRGIVQGRDKMENPGVSFT